MSTLLTSSALPGDVNTSQHKSWIWLTQQAVASRLPYVHILLSVVKAHNHWFTTVIRWWIRNVHIWIHRWEGFENTGVLSHAPP